MKAKRIVPEKRQQITASANAAQLKAKNSALPLTDNRAKPVAQKKENPTGLPDNLKSGIENLSGQSMDDVKVHFNSSQPAQLNAHAYAQGTDIHIASGQEKHLPHEAWHVVQQKQGRVKPTTQLKGKVNINDDRGLEKEADVMGAKAAQMKTAQAEKAKPAKNSFTPVVQGYFKSNDFQVLAGKKARPFVSQESIPQVDDKGKNLGRGTKKSSGKGTSLLVADDQTMAIQDASEPKVFFATDKVVSTSNKKLNNAESPLRLAVLHANTIDVGKKLGSVGPVDVTKNEKKKSGEVAELWDHFCITFTNFVMGNGGFDEGEVVFYNSQTKEQHSQPIAPTGKVSVHINRLSNYLGKKKKKPKNKKQARRTEQSKAIEAINNQGAIRQFPGKLYGEKQGQEQLDNQEQSLGINRYANPDVGEGWSTFSIAGDGTGQLDYSVMKKGEPTTRESTWGYHYAPVIARSDDGNDRVSLENYNRNPQTEEALRRFVFEKFKKEAEKFTRELRQSYQKEKKTLTKKKLADELFYHLAYKSGLIDGSKLSNMENKKKLWFFQMYGPHKGQSFHEKMAQSGLFSNPLTVRVRRNVDEVRKRKLATLTDTRDSILKLTQEQSVFFFPIVRSTLGYLRNGTTALFKKFEKYLNGAKTDADLVKASGRISTEYQTWLSGEFVPVMSQALLSVRRTGKTKKPTSVEDLEQLAFGKEISNAWTLLEDLSDAFSARGALGISRENASAIFQKITKEFPRGLLKTTTIKKIKDEVPVKEDVSKHIGKYHELEGTRIAQLLAMRGLSIAETVKNGNCMYDAVRLQLQRVQGLDVSVETLRGKLVKLIRKNTGFFSGFVNDRDIRTVAQEMSQEHSWDNEGGDIAAEAIATVLQRNIIVISPDGVNVRVPNPLLNSGQCTVPSNGQPLTIVYNGSNHYYSTQ